MTSASATSTASAVPAIAFSRARAFSRFAPSLVGAKRFSSAFCAAVEYVRVMGGDPLTDTKAVKIAEIACLYGKRALPHVKTKGRNARALRRLSACKA